MRVTALTSGRNVPSSRMRVRQFIEPLRALGIDVRERCPRIDKYAPAPSPLLAPAARALKLALRLPDVMASHLADLVWLERELLAGRSTLEKWTGRPRVLDVDDALWLHGVPGFSDRIARDCDGVLAGNEFIAAHYRANGSRVWIVPTVVDTDLWTPRSEGARGDWTIGWIGTSSNLPYLLPLEDALGGFLARRREARLLIVSDRPPAFTRLPSDRWRFVPWSSAAEVALVQQMDIGLMPLPDTDWARGKCSYKMLLYMAVGIPVVFSPVGTNLEVLAHGEVGLPMRDPEQLDQALETLFLDRERGLRMGRLGRQVVEEAYSVRRTAPRLAEIFREVAEGSRR